MLNEKRQVEMLVVFFWIKFLQMKPFFMLCVNIVSVL